MSQLKQLYHKEIVPKLFDSFKFKNIMQAMGPVMKHFGKLADGKQVNHVLKEMK